MTFTLDTSVQHLLSEAFSPNPSVKESGTAVSVDTHGVPTVVSQLAVGCKRKVVIYTWKDGEAQDPKVRLALLHFWNRLGRYSIRNWPCLILLDPSLSHLQTSCLSPIQHRSIPF